MGEGPANSTGEDFPVVIAGRTARDAQPFPHDTQFRCSRAEQSRDKAFWHCGTLRPIAGAIKMGKAALWNSVVP